MATSKISNRINKLTESYVEIIIEKGSEWGMLMFCVQYSPFFI